MPALQRHPDFPCAAVTGIDVEVERPGPRRLLLRYRLSGDIGGLVRRPASGERTDGLWRHTCLEAFVQTPPDAGYRELNLAPGGPWAAYRFDGYREGMANAEMGPPDVPVRGPADFTAVWEMDLPADRAWRVGVSAVIEEVGGRLSYWALAHPAGRPDFHDADCFVLQLPAPEGP